MLLQDGFGEPQGLGTLGSKGAEFLCRLEPVITTTARQDGPRHGSTGLAHQANLVVKGHHLPRRFRQPEIPFIVALGSFYL